MPTFAVPGAELDVELSDEGGHPVVQLHGLTSSRRRDRLLDLDLGRGLSGTRLLRYDARGHGRSTGRDVPEDYRWDVLADDLLLLLDEYFPGEKVHGVGPSMGCCTLLIAAVKDPSRFDGLTLLVPPTIWETRAAKAADYRRAADLVETGGFDAFVVAGRAIKRPPATIGTPETVPDVSAALLPALFRGAALSDLPPREQIATIDAPATILTWIDDPAHPVSSAQALRDVLHDATLSIARTPEQMQRWPEVLRGDVARDVRSRRSPRTEPGAAR